MAAGFFLLLFLLLFLISCHGANETVERSGVSEFAGDGKRTGLQKEMGIMSGGGRSLEKTTKSF